MESIYLIVILSVVSVISIVLSILLYRLSRKNRFLHASNLNLSTSLNECHKELSNTQGRLESAKNQLNEIKQELKEAREKLTVAKTKTAEEETKKLALEDLLQKYQETINQAKQDLHRQFQIAANAILEEKTKSFSENSHKEVKELLAPLKENIDTFHKAVNNTLKENAVDQRTLKDLIVPLDHQLSQFTRALKGDFKVQGDFGETILERMFEMVGFIKGTHYTAQAHDKELMTEEGRRAKPDFLIHLPEDRKVVIDSKVSIKHAIDYFNSDNPTEKEELISKHTNSLKEHIKNLSDKKYQSFFKEESLDFVVMFVPNDFALITALYQDPSLQSFAIEKKVWLTSPTLVMPLLHIIKDFWRINTMNKNVMEISRLAGKMHDQLNGFLHKFSDIKNKLHKAIESYNDANTTLTGQRGVVKYAQKVKELGAKTSKNIAHTQEESLDELEASEDSLEESMELLEKVPENDIVTLNSNFQENRV